MMAASDIYYQVWVHNGQDGRAHVVETYKTELLANKSASMRNAVERHDTRPDMLPNSYYFVRPITEAHLHEAAAERFRRHHKSDRKRFMQQYREEMRPYAQEMAIAMLLSLETCEWTRHNVLIDKGGWLEGYRKDYGDASITCSALYSGIGRVSLEVAIVVCAENDAVFVEEFTSEKALKAWLFDATTAAKAFENRLVDLCCDRYRPRLRAQMENRREEDAMAYEEIPFADEAHVFRVAETLQDIPLRAYMDFLADLTSDDIWATGVYSISIDYLATVGHELTSQPSVHCALLNPDTLSTDHTRLSISSLINVIEHVTKERMREVAEDKIETAYLIALRRDILTKLDTLL